MKTWNRPHKLEVFDGSIGLAWEDKGSKVEGRRNDGLITDSVLEVLEVDFVSCTNRI